MNRKNRLSFLLLTISLGVSSYACDSSNKKSADPAPAINTCKDTSSTTKKSSLSLQSTSSGLQVSYEKATENGKDISSSYSIKALLSKHCISCHKSGGSSATEPPLASFKAAKEAGDDSVAAIKSGDMPQGNEAVGKTILKYFEAWKKAGYPETLSSKSTGSSTATKTSTSTDDDDDDDQSEDATKPTSTSKPSGSSSSSSKTGC